MPPNTIDILATWHGAQTYWTPQDWAIWHSARAHIHLTTDPQEATAHVLATIPSTTLQAAAWAALQLRATGTAGIRVTASDWPSTLTALRRAGINPHQVWWWIDVPPGLWIISDLVRDGLPGPTPDDPSATAVTHDGVRGQFTMARFADHIANVLRPDPTPYLTMTGNLETE